MSAEENDIFLFETKNGNNANHHATCGEITCGLCGTTHNLGADEDGSKSKVYARHIDILDLTIAFCCFEKLENLYVILSSLPNAQEWLAEKLKKDRRFLLRKIENRKTLAEALDSLKKLIGK